MRFLHTTRAVAAVAGLVLLTACTPSVPGPTASGTSSTTSAPAEPTTPLSSTAAPVTGEVPEALLAEIMADLVARTGVDLAAITVVRGEVVTWGDGSLGCPQPGMNYTQALVDGYWVVLEAGGTEYDYRASNRGYFILCEQGGSPPLAPRDR